MFLEISQNSQKNTCARVSFLIKIKKILSYRWFPVNFVKFLRTPWFKTPMGDCLCKKLSWQSNQGNKGKPDGNKRTIKPNQSHILPSTQEYSKEWNFWQSDQNILQELHPYFNQDRISLSDRRKFNKKRTTSKWERRFGNLHGNKYKQKVAKIGKSGVRKRPLYLTSPISTNSKEVYILNFQT